MEKTRTERIPLWFKVNQNGEWYIDWDAERRPFDLIVIHHTAGKPSATAGGIERIHKKRLYKSRYRSEDPDPYVRGLEPHSGHTVREKETFIAYHHLIYPEGNGTTELRPLILIDDVWYVDMVGWHCGNWVANCSSIAICLVGNYSKKDPTDEQIVTLQKLILYYRRFNSALRIEPHYHFNPRTKCPGKWWENWGRIALP